MKKVTKLVLMLGFILSGALCHAHGVVRTEKQKDEGITIEVKEKAFYGSSDKSNAIIPTLNGHVLIVVFTENLGQVAVEVSTASSVSVDYTSTPTPNGVQVYIPYAGNYIVTFTLSNGDEYYGEFTITD